MARLKSKTYYKVSSGGILTKKKKVSSAKWAPEILTKEELAKIQSAVVVPAISKPKKQKKSKKAKSFNSLPKIKKPRAKTTKPDYKCFCGKKFFVKVGCQLPEHTDNAWQYCEGSLETIYDWMI